VSPEDDVLSTRQLASNFAYAVTMSLHEASGRTRADEHPRDARCDAVHGLRVAGPTEDPDDVFGHEHFRPCLPLAARVLRPVAANVAIFGAFYQEHGGDNPRSLARRWAPFGKSATARTERLR